MHGHALSFIVFVAVLGVITGALAQVGSGDANRGHILARKLCVACHAVEVETRTVKIFADVPTFTAIANRQGQTAETVAGKIVLPHPPMPRVQLTRAEIANLAVYIISLKGK